MPVATNKVNNYLSLIKFSHTIFALPFAVIGYFLAITSTKTPFDAKLFIYVILCMVFARSAAMAFIHLGDVSVIFSVMQRIKSAGKSAKSAGMFEPPPCSHRQQGVG